MKSLLISLIILMAFALTPVLSNAQTDQLTTGSSPVSQVSQPLVREGTLAVKLADVLKVEAPANEVEAESVLSAAGIAPRNGWIADYPVTPDIIGELQTAISEAADSGKLAMGKDAALKTFQDVLTEYSLSVKADTSGQGAGETSAPNYPDSTVINNYYYDEGPPVVTYYAPPPDYAYLYTWVPYPFWWWDFWFPGFFVLGDFDRHEHRHGHREHGYDGEHFSNHFRDPRTGRISRIDPANRSHGGTFQDRGGIGWSTPSTQSGAQAVFNSSKRRTGTEVSKEFRGYGVSRPSAGTRSSAFEHSVNSQVEHRASDRGFRSRSSAGQIPARGGGGGGGFHIGGGGGSSRSSGGGGFHGGGRY